MTDYDALARYYDADHGGFADDVPFYRELARRAGPAVLEAMCGSGRLVEPLARAGLQVTGVDSSAAMLALARARVEAAGLGARVTLLQADLRHAELPGRFDLAIVALNSFMHLAAVSDQLAALARLHTALKPGALLAIDLFNPDVRGLPECDGELVLDRSFQLADGTRVQKFVAQRADMAAQRNFVTFIYDELDAQGHVRRTVQQLTLRWLYRFEVEHLLARAGFALESVYGSYDLDDYRSGSEIMLAVARRT